jgi:hypothetical protein
MGHGDRRARRWRPLIYLEQMDGAQIGSIEVAQGQSPHRGADGTNRFAVDIAGPRSALNGLVKARTLCDPDMSKPQRLEIAARQKRRTRILSTWHVITCEYPPQQGRVADYTRLVALGLAASGDRIHVWAPAVTDEVPADDVEVHRLPGSFGPRALDNLSRGIAATTRADITFLVSS